jgi:flavin reductase (DIM6/NTAB) family NADH-FMN oxidoreductase RutF
MAYSEVQLQDFFQISAPIPYALGVTLDVNDNPNIIGLNWFTIVSWSPPMMMISVAFQRYTFECLEHHDEFTLVLPSKKQAKSAWLCGTKSGRSVDKVKEAGFKMIEAKLVQTPLIADATACVECRIVNRVDAGDHRIYIADVVAFHVDSGKPDHLYSKMPEKLIGLGPALVIDKNLF